MNINWALLRQQKAALVRMAMAGDEFDQYERDVFDGVINLLDTLQDEAVSSGLADEENVFGAGYADYSEPPTSVDAAVEPMQLITTLRNMGYLVVAWNPKEMEGMTADDYVDIEDACTSVGTVMIDARRVDEELADDTSCPLCGEDGGTTCGAINCGY